MRDTPIIYLPATRDRPAEPAPFVLTGDEVLRLLRMDGKTDPDSQLKRLRAKGWLRAAKLGTELVYPLANAMRCVELAQEEDPR